MIRQSGGGSVCSAKYCKNKHYNCNRSFFRFPIDPDRAKQWAINSNREDLLKNVDKLYRSSRLCSLHFESEMFTNVFCRRLKHTAIPTIFPLEECSKDLSLDHSYSLPQHVNLTNQKIVDKVVLNSQPHNVNNIPTNKDLYSEVQVETNSKTPENHNFPSVSSVESDSSPMSREESNSFTTPANGESILARLLRAGPNKKNETDKLKTQNSHQQNQKSCTENNFISDSDSSCSTSDVRWVSTSYRSDSSSGEINLDYAKHTLMQQKKQILALQRNERRLKAKNGTYKMLCKYLKDNNLLTEDGHSVISAFLKK